MNSEQEFLIQEIEELVHKRDTTDRRMGYVWMIVPILPIIVAILVLSSFVSSIIALASSATANQPPPTSLATQLAGLYVFAIFSLYAVLLVGAAAIYYLIERRNAHFARQYRLFMSVADYVNSDSKSSAAKLFKLARDESFEEPHKPAAIWAVLYVLIAPLASLLVGYGLTCDIRKHAETQVAYEQTLTNALAETGKTMPSTTPQIHKREPVLYLILTLITGGIFWVYWYYTLLRDYNDHFKKQAAFEDRILAAFKPPEPKKFCHACGMTIPATARFCPSCGKEQV